jgi:3-phenylpropionate/trans-cinnamate dioxygenase ferredoxin reductase subunit
MVPRVVVAGASMAGLRVAEQLVRAGHTGPVTVFGAEPHPPYNRPPLSKTALTYPHLDTADDVLQTLALRRGESPQIEFRLGEGLVAADLANRTVRTIEGHTEGFDGLVIATGLRPRRLQVPGPERGRFALRTVEDCLVLRAALPGARRAVVVGGGFIGCEVAATLHSLGVAVTVVEPGPAAMTRALGFELGSAIQRHHESNGIGFRTEALVTEILGTDRVSGVVLSTGALLTADIVVEAIGSHPNTEWLQGNSALDLTDGVLCDTDLRVQGAQCAVAAGDVARFPHPLFGSRPRRFEHWTMVTETARRAARTLHAELTGTPNDLAPAVGPPSFWTDQGLIHLQAVGAVARSDEMSVVEGRLDRLADGALLVGRADGRVCCAITVNLPATRLAPWRSEITEQLQQMTTRRTVADNS